MKSWLGWSGRAIRLASYVLSATSCALAAVPGNQCPQTTAALYSRIRSVGLDPQRVYHVRDASIDRPNLFIDLDDGTLAFTEDICGRITGAVFEGEGEIRLRPPNQAERGSMALFTGMAILEEQFSSGYLRFNDTTAAVLQPYLNPVPPSEGAEFIKHWGEPSRNLADFDALRLLLDFSHFLPLAAGNEPDRSFPRLLHAHLFGKKLGSFEVFWDAANAEALWAGQPRTKDGLVFFDIWTSFSPAWTRDGAQASLADDVSITRFRIRASVEPPTRLSATTEAMVRVRNGGERTLLFALSHYLKVDLVEADGRAVDFIQNPAIEGTQLRRKGDDLVAVVFPAPLAPGVELKLRFSYAGEVLSEAGKGLLYVGERGTWYPNFGLNPAQFEMEFHYPANWTLLATGKQIPIAGSEKGSANAEAGTDKVSRWTSERPIPVAGFNLGKYVRAEAKAGNILVEAYGTRGVEKSFPQPRPDENEPVFPVGPRRVRPLPNLPPPPPSPARDTQAVADKAAKAIESFTQWFGPYPYSSLALTQMPGDLSQGWPGLVFLSSFAFLSPQEQADLRLDPVTRTIDSQVLVHETAHQWWGDLVLWKSYRDQWIAEGLANYSSLLTLERQNPVQFREVLEKYRRDLLSENKDGEKLRDAGPVTLGLRLESSHFPGGYDAISYERGTWLFHMLRCMFRDAEATTSRTGRANTDEPFFRALRKIRERYAGKRLRTEELVEVFEEELPRPLWYEKRRKLDWFLEGWIEGTAIPELRVRDVRISEKSGETGADATKTGEFKTGESKTDAATTGATTITGVIVQKDAPEDLVTAIPVYAATTGNALVFLGVVLADGAETAFRLTAPSDARKVVLDPKHTILSALK